MQTPKQALVVVRDQFALKGLSDDALRLILPAYRTAIQRIVSVLENMPEASIERQLWLKTQLSTIKAQFGPVADRIYDVLPQAQARAFEESLSNAEKYLEAGGITPKPEAVSLTGSTTTGQTVAVSGNQPGLNVTGATDKGFLSPSITRQQVIAASRETGFSVFSPGGKSIGLKELLPQWMNAQAKQVEQHLRTGFLLGRSNDEIVREIGPLGPGRKGRAMTEALVRTGMAEASQAAHDAFYEANEDLLLPTKSGNRWWWDASNDTRLCTVCAPLDGLKFKERSSPPYTWPAHIGCRCKILPLTATMEAMQEKGIVPNGSFLEAQPVEYVKVNGRLKRLPPPAGFSGDNAYKRPMKIDGKMQWVRRKDLGPGQTTAGDMLKNANEHSKKLILGTQARVDEWNKKIKLKKYANDPQQLVRDMLGSGGGGNGGPAKPAPKPRPPAPTPKPKATPKTKVPQSLEQEGKDVLSRVAPELNSYSSIERKAQTVLAARTQAMMNAKTPEAKEIARKAYLRAANIENRAAAKVSKAMEKVRKEMLKTDLPKENQKAIIDGIRFEGWGTKKKLVNDTKKQVQEFIQMFNGQGFTATGSTPWVQRLEPDLMGRGFNRLNGQVAVRIGSKENLFHELMHTVEAQRPSMGRTAREWILSKAYALDNPKLAAALKGKEMSIRNGKPVFKLSDITGNDYANEEVAWKDDFINGYMGKDYGRDVTEVWTMAAEHFTDSRTMGALFRRHPDLFRMMVGLSKRTY